MEPKESQNLLNENNNNKNKSNEMGSENKINEEEINIDLIQKKLEEQGEVNNIENDLFSNKLDSLLENIAKIIASEKDKLKLRKETLYHEKEEFKEKCQKEILNYEREKEIWKENLEKAKSLECNEEDIIDLNIGGTHMLTTTKNTLCKYPSSTLALLFSGNHSLQKYKGRYFIDRDGDTFLKLIDFLRNDALPNFETDEEKIHFFEELEYWQIPVNKFIQSNGKSPFIFDTQWCAETLNIESSGKIIKKNTEQHGIVFCHPQLDKDNNYVEFYVSMTVPCRGKSHLFLGLVKKTSYRNEQLLSTFWKDCPSSYYWDVWNTKLIKIDDNGTQVGTILGYGCQCEDYDTKFGIKYNAKEKTVEFFKNGANLGIAFRNVPPGLNPSLDIWFESGTVQILDSKEPTKRIFI